MVEDQLSKMLNILIIGLGNIGGYHLQSLTKLRENAKVYLYDKSICSVNKAVLRFQENYIKREQNTEIEIIKLVNLKILPKVIDFCIIATPSAPRKNIFLDLLNRQNLEIKFFLLEKFLFPKIQDYYDILTKLENNNLKVYVNEWISSSYIFRRIASILDINKTKYPLKMSVKGSKWGLECNSVHFIDYFHFLINRKEIKLKESNITKHMPSKRNGYLEFFGDITIESNNGSTLYLSSNVDGDTLKVDLSFKTDTNHIECKMWNNGILDIIYNINDKNYLESVKIPFQSEITYEIIQNAIEYNSVNLPTLKEASIHHLLVCYGLKNYNMKNFPDFVISQEYKIT